MNPKELKRLSNLELASFSGEPDALQDWDLVHARGLYQTPVEVTVIAEEGVCDRGLYLLGLEFAGLHDTFSGLRDAVTERLAQTFNPPAGLLLSVLFDGIYVGNLEDLNNLRAKQPDLVMYRIKGLGTKFADITFQDS